MTVLQSTKNLIQWFQNHDSFNLQDDFINLFPNYISETPEADKSSIISALDELVKNNILLKSEYNKKFYYNLIKPLSTLSQTVNLSFITTQLISEMLTTLAEKLDNPSIAFNSLQIEEKDILLLLTLLSDLKTKENQ